MGEGTIALAGGRRQGGWGVLIGTKSLSTAPGVRTHPVRPRPNQLLGPGGLISENTPVRTPSSRTAGRSWSGSCMSLAKACKSSSLKGWPGLIVAMEA